MTRKLFCGGGHHDPAPGVASFPSRRFSFWGADILAMFAVLATFPTHKILGITNMNRAGEMATLFEPMAAVLVHGRSEAR